jgi:hypothetical protein
MRTARRTRSEAHILPEKHSLALMAQSPAALLSCIIFTQNSGIADALASVMSLIVRRTNALVWSLTWITSEEQSLALMAPSPPPLLSRTYTSNNSIRAALARVMSLMVGGTNPSQTCIRQGTRGEGYIGLASNRGTNIAVLALDLDVVETLFESEPRDLGALRLGRAVGDQRQLDAQLPSAGRRADELHGLVLEPRSRLGGDLKDITIAMHHRQIEADTSPAQPIATGDDPHRPTGGMSVFMGVVGESVARLRVAMAHCRSCPLSFRTPARLSFWPGPARFLRLGGRIRWAWCQTHRTRWPAPSRGRPPSHARSAR